MDENHLSMSVLEIKHTRKGQLKKINVHCLSVLGYPSPQTGHGQPQAGSQSTPSPQMIIPKGGVVRRNLRGWREWRRADPTLINSLWRSKMGNGIRKQLGL